MIPVKLSRNHLRVNLAFYFQKLVVKNKHTRLSIENRVQILERLEKGETASRLAKEYKVTNSAITLMKKSKENLIKKRNSILMCQGETSKKRCTDIESSSLEQALYKWFMQKKSIGESVNGPMLQKKVLELSKTIDGRDIKCPRGFVDRFKRRHNIKFSSRSKQEQRLSYGNEENGDFCREFRKYVADNEISLDRVYNADATGLRWKMLPKALVAHSGGCLMRWKKFVEDRVALVVCANATGSHKLPLFVVGRDDHPHCLRNIKSVPVVYAGQQNARMDRRLILQWYRKVFLPEIERVHRSADEQCLLLLNNAPINLSIERFDSIGKRCQVILVSPKVTSLAQPVQQGIIEKLKRIYKKDLLRLLLTADAVEDVCVQKALKPIDLLKCCYFLKNAWDKVTGVNVQNGWRHIFPSCSNLKVEVDSDEDVRSLFDMMEKMPEYNTTMEEINIWLHNNDNEQGWDVANDERATSSEHQRRDVNHEENREEENDLKERPNDEDFCDGPYPSAKNAFDAINTFMFWYQNQDQFSSQDSEYLLKLWRYTLDQILLLKSVHIFC